MYGFPVNNPYQTPSPILQPVSPVPPMQVTQGPQLIKVNGLESAKAYQTVPNSTIALFDANEDIMYIKTTDASNFPTIRAFDFVERKEEKKVDNVEYVTSDVFNKVINELREEIQNGKQFVQSAESANTNQSDGRFTRPTNQGKGNNGSTADLQKSARGNSRNSQE